MKKISIFLGSLLIVSVLLGSQEEKPPPKDPWTLFRLLIGSWSGSIDGKFGTGNGIREYRFILGDRFVLSRHESIRPPQEKSPKGDHHRELGVFSLDRERGKLVYRQFLVEGFVSQYVCEVEPRGFVCLTESVENGAGLRARWSVDIQDRYHFQESFELASGENDFELYFSNQWNRRPALE